MGSNQSSSSEAQKQLIQEIQSFIQSGSPPNPHPPKINQARWFWNSCKDPWVKGAKPIWTPYSDIENVIVEEAFKIGLEEVSIGSYKVSLKTKTQIHKDDDHRRRPIRRVEEVKEETDLRQKRFFEEIAKPKMINPAIVSSYPLLVREWMLKYKNISCYLNVDEYGSIVSDPANVVEKIVELAVIGIMKEAVKLNKKDEGLLISKKLKDTLTHYPDYILKCCVSLYTLETFLYDIINAALVEENLEKLENLGPFCYLLNYFLQECSKDSNKPSCFCYEGCVYKGAVLSQDVIEEYKQLPQGKLFVWDSFISASKDRQKAEKLGNALFIIELGGDEEVGYGTDISYLSYYGNAEEEILMPAGSIYCLQKIETKDGKTIIYLFRKDLKGLDTNKEEKKEDLSQITLQENLYRIYVYDGPKKFDALRVYRQSEFTNERVEATLLNLPPFKYPDLDLNANPTIAYVDEIARFGDHLVYEGEWDMLSQKPAGRGVFVLQDGRIYEGMITDGNPSGIGRTILKDGSVYEGEYKNGSPSGKGKYTWGRYTERYGDVYEGDVKNAKGNGSGTLTFKNGDMYIGQFENALMHDEKGRMIYADGRTYEGEWIEGMMHGKGVLTWPTKRIYRGEFVKNVIKGNGVMTYDNEKMEKGSFDRGILVKEN